MALSYFTNIHILLRLKRAKNDIFLATIRFLLELVNLANIEVMNKGINEEQWH